jgi:hypothetical protein
VQDDLTKVLYALQNVGSLTPLHDASDKDHMSEDQLAAIMRKKREEERLLEQMTPPLTSEVTDE